jgi:hypothetical protein
MISDPNLAPVPHPQFLVAALLLLHLVLVQELTAWRAALVADVLTVEVAMAIVLMTGHLTVRLDWSLVYLQGVKTLPRTPEVIEAESEHLLETVIERERAKETETLAGTDMVKGTATETEKRSEIGTGRETGRGRETRTRTKIAIVVTETENVIGIATVIATVTVEMRRIVIGIRGKIARFLVVVLLQRQLLLPWTLVICLLVRIPQGTVAGHS